MDLMNLLFCQEERFVSNERKFLGATKKKTLVIEKAD